MPATDSTPASVTDDRAEFILAAVTGALAVTDDVHVNVWVDSREAWDTLIAVLHDKTIPIVAQVVRHRRSQTPRLHVGSANPLACPVTVFGPDEPLPLDAYGSAAFSEDDLQDMEDER